MSILSHSSHVTGDFVLHPTDLSEASETAFHHALAIAIRNGAQFTLLHAIGRRATDSWPGFPRVRDTLAKWRAAGTTAGLNFGTADELRYHWNGGNWGWDSGLVLPDNQWVFTALVVKPDEAFLYLGDGGVLSSNRNKVEHSAEEWDGAVMIGHDPSSSARYFRGWLDDVRIFDAALTPQELRNLYDATRP